MEGSGGGGLSFRPDSKSRNSTISSTSDSASELKTDCLTDGLSDLCSVSCVFQTLGTVTIAG
eukprot:1148825-Amphidinium_carterae.2